MLRIAFAVIVGYVAMALAVLLVFSVVLIAPDVAMWPGTSQATPAWIVYTLIASFAAAIAGGWLSARIAATRRAATAMAVVALLLGLAAAFQNEQRRRTPPAPLSPSATTLERASRAVQPTAYAFSIPFLSAAGVLLGGRLRGLGSNATGTDASTPRS